MNTCDVTDGSAYGGTVHWIWPLLISYTSLFVTTALPLHQSHTLNQSRFVDRFSKHFIPAPSFNTNHDAHDNLFFRIFPTACKEGYQATIWSSMRKYLSRLVQCLSARLYVWKHITSPHMLRAWSQTSCQHLLCLPAHPLLTPALVAFLRPSCRQPAGQALAMSSLLQVRLSPSLCVSSVKALAIPIYTRMLLTPSSLAT